MRREDKDIERKFDFGDTNNIQVSQGQSNVSSLKTLFTTGISDCSCLIIVNKKGEAMLIHVDQFLTFNDESLERKLAEFNVLEPEQRYAVLLQGNCGSPPKSREVWLKTVLAKYNVAELPATKIIQQYARHLSIAYDPTEKIVYTKAVKGEGEYEYIAHNDLFPNVEFAPDREFDGKLAKYREMEKQVDRFLLNIENSFEGDTKALKQALAFDLTQLNEGHKDKIYRIIRDVEPDNILGENISATFEKTVALKDLSETLTELFSEKKKGRVERKFERYYADLKELAEDSAAEAGGVAMVDAAEGGVGGGAMAAAAAAMPRKVEKATMANVGGAGLVGAALAKTAEEEKEI
jgi:hypothetical protein